MSKRKTREAPADPFAALADLGTLAGQVARGGKEAGPETPPEPVGAVAPPAALNQDPQLVGDFLMESREHLANIEARLLEIEQGAHTAETLNSAFRSFHTIKGLAGFLEFEVIQRVSHEVETLLDLARNGQLALDPATVDVVLKSGDYLSSWLRYLEAGLRGAPAAEPGDPGPLIEQVRAAATGNLGAEEEPAGPPREESPARIEEPSGPSDGGKPPAGARRNGETQSEASLVKVDTAKLEFLVDMVGELVIAQSMLRHNPDLSGLRSARLQRDVTHLSRVTAEVQKTAMAMRMVPVGNLFRRMNRLVRDLARKSGKLAELETQGEDVELDRTIVEVLADPLVHMIRNSMDHGLEAPAEREAAGKPRAGRIRLKASHQAGLIVIEVGDDGRGLDRERILAKAAQRGLVQSDHSLNDAEAYQLIFEPGFSTAEKVTDVSGRGVGMDVVRKQISKLRGRIDIESSPGAGTTFLLRLPLTLAIIDGLVVVVGEERFIVPIFAVREMFKPSVDQIFTVEGRGEMALVRERLMPVVRLGRRLGLNSGSRAPAEGLMIVGEAGARQFCLLVDELVGKQEVVIKSLGPTFRDVRGVAGGAILGDGRVGLILDVAALAGVDTHG
jgi:two-component system chemotaxis sensor kinase CheA